MKSFFTFLLILFASLSFAQEWAPVGAEWYYDIEYIYSGGIDYHRIYCDSIVNLKGIDCKRITINNNACNHHFTGDIYTYEQNDTIFFYNPDIDTFQVLYNFNANKNENWEIWVKVDENDIDTVTIKVDSVETTQINGISLKKLYVDYSYNYLVDPRFEKSIIIEKLGDLNLLVNVASNYDGFCDIYRIHSLRCYEDAEIGNYSTGHRDSCTYIWDNTHLKNQTELPVNIYPNPVVDYLHIQSNSTSAISYTIYDVTGGMVKNGLGYTIDLSAFHRGIYFIKVKSNRQSVTRKFTKH